MRIIATAVLLIALLVVLILLTAVAGPGLDPASTQVMQWLVVLTAIIAIVCFLLGEITANYSQVDKIWSIAPIAYVWIVAWLGDFHTRLVVIGLLVTLWGARLTFNFWLKGGYHWRFWEGGEDYRWQVLRQKPEFRPRWKWTLFNLFFISGFQNALILMMTLPVVVAMQFNDSPFNVIDTMAAITVLFFVVFESIADWQQWSYQENKRTRANGTGDDQSMGNDPGFLHRGLWALSRHPNYFAEQSIWVAFYFFSVAASGQWINWSAAGWVLLVVLFQGSSRFSEEISASKYPEYKNYQRTVPRFLPIGRKLFDA